MSEYSRQIVAGVLVAVLITAFVAIEIGSLYSTNTESSSHTSSHASSQSAQNSLISSTLRSSDLVESATATSSNGLQLSISLNASYFSVGQRIQVNASLFNTLSGINNIQTADEWLFRGIPMALWPDCYYTNFHAPANYTTAAEAVVLPGYYTMANISATADVYIHRTACHEAMFVEEAAFQPGSAVANLTGLGGIDGKTNVTAGPYQIVNSFVTNGYWDLSSNSQRDFPLTNSTGQPPFLNYAGQLSGPAPTATAFVPGVYTVAVADEWGIAVVLHFEVVEG